MYKLWTQLNGLLHLLAAAAHTKTAQDTRQSKVGQHSAGFQDTQNTSTTKHTHREREKIASYLTRALVW